MNTPLLSPNNIILFVTGFLIKHDFAKIKKFDDLIVFVTVSYLYCEFYYFIKHHVIVRL